MRNAWQERIPFVLQRTKEGFFSGGQDGDTTFQESPCSARLSAVGKSSERGVGAAAESAPGNQIRLSQISAIFRIHFEEKIRHIFPPHSTSQLSQTLLALPTRFLRVSPASRPLRRPHAPPLFSFADNFNSSTRSGARATRSESARLAARAGTGRDRALRNSTLTGPMSDSLVASAIHNRTRQDYGLDGDELMFGDFCFTYVLPAPIRTPHRSDQFFLHAFQVRKRYARHALLLSRVSTIRFESNARFPRVFAGVIGRSPPRRIEQIRLLHAALLPQQ